MNLKRKRFTDYSVLTLQMHPNGITSNQNDSQPAQSNPTTEDKGNEIKDSDIKSKPTNNGKIKNERVSAGFASFTSYEFLEEIRKHRCKNKIASQQV